MTKLLEVLSNVAVIVVAGIFGFVLIERYVHPAQAADPQAAAQEQDQPHPTVGAPVNIANAQWTGYDKTLVMALQTSCHFCNESAPFYKKVIDAVAGKNIKLVAIFPTAVEESAAHLKDLGLTGIEVRQAPLDSVHVNGTPTLILTNNKGETTNYWVGKLKPEQENEVISKLTS